MLTRAWAEPQVLHMLQHLRSVWPYWLAACCLALIGCSQLPEGHVDVTGTILRPDGTPFTSDIAIVRFEPAEQDLRETRTSTGLLEEDGSFEILTYDEYDGVPLGTYKVVLYLGDIDEQAKLAQGVHDDFTHYETTPWQVEVTAEGDNHFQLQLTEDGAGATK